MSEAFCVPAALLLVNVAFVFPQSLVFHGAEPMSESTHASPTHINPIQWHHALAVSRQACARVFRDGGTPGEAVAAFGIVVPEQISWEKAVDQIANELCAHPLPCAA